MAINELRISVNNSMFSLLLPEATLQAVVEPLEELLGLQGMIFVNDAHGNIRYGHRRYEHPAASSLIMVDGDAIGVVGICPPDDDPHFEQVADYLAQSLGMLAVEASRRRRLADEVLERYDELNLIYDLAALIARHNMSLYDIMRAVLEETNRILRAESGVIYIYDDEHAELIPVSHFGRRSDEHFWQGHTRELALSTLHAYDTTQLSEGGRVICAPLRYDTELLGALVLMHEGSGRVFNANDVNLLTTLAYNTALFIRAARLFDSLNQRNRELESTLAELQSTRDELSRAERLSIIGQIVGGLVHDMRTPLNVVMGYAGLLQEGGLTEAEVSEYATQIITFVNTFSSMAQEILDYARDDERIERQEEDLDEYMQFVENLLKPPGLKRQVRIVVDSSAARDVSIHIDRQRFARVFQNLVNNAVDAIEDHGGSRVVVRAEPADSHRIRFLISDDGPGISPEVASKMFEPLTTTKPQGTGLGLAIVKRMVLKHDGEIHYEPSPEGGATFIITIPLV
jgi:signal transduction histidine kinase